MEQRKIEFIRKLSKTFLTGRIAVVRFALAGGVNTGVDWGIFYAAALILPETVAKIAGIVGGITSAFLLNSLWVFRASFKGELARTSAEKKAGLVAKKYGLHVATYSFGMVINVVVFTLLRRVELIRIGALAAATACSLSFNFLLSRKIFGHVLEDREQTNNEQINREQIKKEVKNEGQR